MCMTFLFIIISVLLSISVILRIFAIGGSLATKRISLNNEPRVEPYKF